MYKLLKNPFTNEELKVIQRLSDNCFIPFNPDISGYQKYLEWLAEGNTPEPADEQN